MPDRKIQNFNELEFAVFCIENVAAKLGVGAEQVYQAFTEKSDILNGYIVPGYEILAVKKTGRTKKEPEKTDRIKEVP